MLRSKYLVRLVLVATLMATLVQFSAIVYAQNQEEKRAVRFLALAEQSKEQVESLTEFVEAQGIDVTEEAITLYDTGSASLEQAWEAFDGGDYEGAIELAKEALWNFREAIKVLNKALEPIEEEIEAESEHSALGEAITRAGDRITRVVGIIDAMLVFYPDLDTTGILSDIRDTLEVDAEGHLAVAQTCLGAGDVAGATKELGEAHRLISSALVSLKKSAGALNSGRIKGFLTVIKKFHERLTNLVERTIEEPLKTTLKKELDDIMKLYIDAAELPTATFSERMSNLMMARSFLESIQRSIVESRRE